MHVTQVRVRYGETDKMGVVYHANYFQYFEVGRTDLIRKYGKTYADLEAEGVLLPVVELEARFHLPARYDDILSIETRVTQVTVVRVRFEYAIRRPSDDGLITEGSTVLASVTPEGRPQRMPEDMRSALLDAMHKGEAQSQEPTV